MKPLLLLDVDGPLNPYRAEDPAGYELHKLAPGGFTFDVWLNKDHGPRLIEFADAWGMELVWATMWEHDANTMIAPVIGLPWLPVIEWYDRPGSWKFGPVLEYAGDRPLAWFDDDFFRFPKGEAWFRQERDDRPTLLHEVDPAIGLRESDLTAVAEWMAGGA